jgi:transcriptional regulator with XRE-family HTH domain
MTQNERVKEVRKSLGLTLEKFGNKLGVQKSAISKIEKGENSLTDANIKAICREFGVDYIWLTTGEGEMFVESDDEFLGRIDQVMAGENEVRKNMIKTLLYASDDDIEALDRLVDYYYTLKYGEEKKTDGT